MSLRRCDGCDVVDEDPRTVYVQPDDSELLFHPTCVPKYIRVEHPDPSYELADSGLRGQELIDAKAAAVAAAAPAAVASEEKI